MDCWIVKLNGREIDRVFTGRPPQTAAEVRDSLVRHDGYDTAIVVRKQPKPRA